jgi:hypothetical protein
MTRVTIRPRYVAVTAGCLCLATAVPFTIPLLAQPQVSNALLLGVILASVVFVTVYGRCAYFRIPIG